jgi:hypothetical protein
LALLPADDPEILAYAALVLASFGEDIGAMTALVDRALALNLSRFRYRLATTFGPGRL